MSLNERLHELRELRRRLWRFVSEEIWDLDVGSLSALRGFGVRTLRVLHLVIRGFREDECPLHASALTFNTLMSIVPILALSLALARGLGDAETAKNKIRSAVSDWTKSFRSPVVTVTNAPGTQAVADTAAVGATNNVEFLAPSELAEQIDNLVEQAFEKVENISFAALGSSSLVLLIWMVIAVLGRVEGSFNRVWGVARGRSVWRRFTDYVSVLVIMPLLAVAATSLPVADFATRFLDESTARVVHSLLGSDLLRNLTVLLLTTLCFTFLLMFMPNARVRIAAGLVGGLVVALLFVGWLRLCAALQVGVARYGRIYGSFAVGPIILAWVYVSWQIVLFGAEVAFAVQNCGTYRFERGARKASLNARAMLALSLVVELARAMRDGDRRGLDVAAYARERSMPVRFLNEVVAELTEAGLLGELAGAEGRYVLLAAPGDLGVKRVLDAVMQSGADPSSLGLSQIDPAIATLLRKADGSVDQSMGGATVRDLLSAAPQPA